MATRTTKYEIYLMNVPFNSSYKDVVLFSSSTNQENTFKNLQEYHYTNLNIIVKNSAFILAGRWDKFNECNYMMWRYKDDYGTDNDHTSKWYFSFIKDVQYNTRLGTIITHEIDVWQTYHINAKFNKAYLERGHVLSDDDIIGKWIAPEPIGFGASNEEDINLFAGVNFSPTLVIESLTKPESRIVTVTGGDYPQYNFMEYEYGGTGGASNSSISGYYRIIPENGKLNLCLGAWQSPEYIRELVPQQPLTKDQFSELMQQNTNHIGDIISFTILPHFLIYDFDNSTNFQNIQGYDGSHGLTVVGKSVENSNFISDEFFVDYSTQHLACVDIYDTSSIQHPYEPVNKKLFTSLARTFKVYNKNGLSIPINPELLTPVIENGTVHNSRVKIRLEGHTFGNEIKLTIVNLNDITNNYFNIPFYYKFEYGINNNVGVKKAYQDASYYNSRTLATLGYISGGIGLATQIGSAVATGALAQDMPVITPMLEARKSFMETQSGLQSFGAIGSAINLGSNILTTEFDLSYDRTNAYRSQTLSLGTANNDRISTSEDFSKLRFAECNPTYQQCKLIDEFLTRYGYSIMQIVNIKPWLSHRNKWNYIKTKDIRVETNSPDSDNIVFNNILNAGTTVWQDVSYVGNYNLDNE